MVNLNLILGFVWLLTCILVLATSPYFPDEHQSRVRTAAIMAAALAGYNFVRFMVSLWLKRREISRDEPYQPPPDRPVLHPEFDPNRDDGSKRKDDV